MGYTHKMAPPTRMVQLATPDWDATTSKEASTYQKTNKSFPSSTQPPYTNFRLQITIDTSHASKVCHRHTHQKYQSSSLHYVLSKSFNIQHTTTLSQLYPYTITILSSVLSTSSYRLPNHLIQHLDKIVFNL